MSDFFLTLSYSGKKQFNLEDIIEQYKSIYDNPSIVKNITDKLQVLLISNPSLPSVKPLFSNKLRKHLWVCGNLLLTNKMKENYSLKENSLIPNDESLLNLFEDKGIEVFKEFAGWFNVITYSVDSNEIEIINSRLGLIPLYYFVKEDKVIISSRLSAFFKTLQNIEIDSGAVIQQCLYNYTFSDFTYIKNVKCLPASVVAKITSSKVTLKSYWSVRDEFVDKPLNTKDSSELFDETFNSLIKSISDIQKKWCISLTGGWDCRLILAYALKYKAKEDIFLYSFGAKDSPDITIPAEISKKHKLNYIPIILDEDYLKTKFIDSARKTILYSDSHRSLKRAHYLYAIDMIRQHSSLIITGIGGSNLLKSTAYSANNVFNKFVLGLIKNSNFEEELESQYSFIKSNYNFISNDFKYQDFIESFDIPYLKQLHEIDNVDERFCTYLVSNIERKYFGAEISTYRHLVFNYSPFFDYEFLQTLLKTSFFGGYNSIKLFPVLRNALLYSKLINRNNEFLGKENTDRNIPLYNMNTPGKYFNSLIKYLSKKNSAREKSSDLYNTRNVTQLFINTENTGMKNILHNHNINNDFIANYISINWYINKMSNGNLILK